MSFDDQTEMERLFARSKLVAAGLDHRKAHLAAWAKRVGTKIVYTSEYVLRTRFQIIDADGGSLLRRAKQKTWAAMQEARYFRALRLADAVHCNGEPTYRSYRHVAKDTFAARVDHLRSAVLEPHLHYTPTYASWLNLVERFFALLTDEALRRGSHTSIPQLRRAILDYVAVHNKEGKPFKWTKTADEILDKVRAFGERTLKVHGDA